MKKKADALSKNNNLEKKVSELEGKVSELEKWENEEYLMGVFESKYNDAFLKYSDLLVKAKTLEDMLHPYDCGVYEPEFDYSDSETYKNNRLHAFEKAKAMVKNKRACV